MKTHNIPFSTKKTTKKITLIYPKSAARRFFSKGLKNEFETAVVNEPLVVEPLKFYCIEVATLLKTINKRIQQRNINEPQQKYRLETVIKNY